MSEDFSRALRERVDAIAPRIDVDTSHVIAGARRRRALRRSATATVVLTAVVALVVALSAQPWASWTSTPPAATPTPTATTEPISPDAPYWRTRYEVETDGVVTSRAELWTPRTGHGLLVQDGDLSGATTTSAFAQPIRIDGTTTTLTWDQLRDLPTDTAELEAFARAGILDGTGDPDAAVLTLLVDLVRAPVTMEVRRAAWRAASGLPGVVATTGVTGSRGQEGTLLERDGSTYLYDTTTGMLLQYTSHGVRTVYLEQFIEMRLPEDAPTPQG